MACQSNRSWSHSPASGAATDPTARSAEARSFPLVAGAACALVAIAPVPLQLLRHEVEVERREDEVQEEQQKERDDHRLVDGVTHALWPALGVEALIAGDHPSDVPAD